MSISYEALKRAYSRRLAAYVFIDGGYVMKIIRKFCTSNLAKDILDDPLKHARFLEYLLSRFNSMELPPIGRVVVVRKLYYDAIVPLEDDSEEHERRKKFFDGLRLHMDMCEVKLGDRVKAKSGYRQKGVDTLIAIDMITKAFLGHYDVAFLVAGDRDFVSVVKAVKDYTGKLVLGIYEPKSASEELLRSFDRGYPIREDEVKNICNRLK